jgi:hypothetical protein
LAKRAIAAIVMTAAVAGILAGLAGVVAVWAVKARWTGDALAALGGLELDLQVGADSLRKVESHLAAGREDLNAISLTAEGAADKLGQPRLVELTRSVQRNLSEIDGTVQEVNVRLAQVEEGVNNLVTLANKLPGVEVPALDVKLLDGVSGLLTDANGRLQDLADEATGGKVTVTQEMAGIAGTVEQVRGRLGAVELSISDASARLISAQGALREWAEKLPAMLQRAAVLLTVGLIWFVAGQVGLFMWMRSVYRGAPHAD